MGRSGSVTPRLVRKTGSVRLVAPPPASMEISVDGVGDGEAAVLLTGDEGPTVEEAE